MNPLTAIRSRPHRVWWQNPGPPIPDPDGGYILTWTDLVPPAQWAHIEPATASSLETVAAGTVLGVATHILRVPFHPDIALKTRALFEGRTFEVADVKNLEFGDRELAVLVAEVLPV
jgi:head-tail adaptor